MLILVSVQNSEADALMFHFEATGDLRRAEGAHALRGLRAGNKEEDPEDERCVVGCHAIACPFHFSLSFSGQKHV